MPASKFPGGAAEVGAAVLEEGAWLAIISMFRLLSINIGLRLTQIIVNEGSTSRLNQSLFSPNPSYNGSQALTVFGVEARNENAL